MKKFLLFIPVSCISFFFLFPAASHSQHLMLGMRSTLSAFNDDGASGMGVGGQFRLRLGSRLNTDWFADYITTDIQGLAKRTDYHIGWSVLCYPLNHEIKKNSFVPYILAGHCFDYTEVQKNNIWSSLTSPNFAARWSSAVQSGLGAHYYLADNVDVSLTAQYMLHLGKSIETQVFTNAADRKDVQIYQGNLGLEGHLLINLSLNLYIAKLWKIKNTN